MTRFLLKLIFLVILLGAGAAAWLWHYTWTPLNFEESQHTVVVKSGSNVRLVARQLAAENVLSEPWSFFLMARLSGRASELKAGNYVLTSGMTPYNMFEAMTNGTDSTQSGVTFIEGWTFHQMREELNRTEGLEHVSMAMTDGEILSRIGATETHPEGLFFPDTYYFAENISDIDLLQRAYQAMQIKLAEAWELRVDNLPYTNSYQALIMASVVEKETGKGSERPVIAKVFLNRLKIGMRLQTDPTVIYGMGANFKGNIRKQDLLKDTAYNTYTRNGLPPTPIAMPGLAAIEAALHPDSSANYLYFVGKGDGSHAFSATLEEHNRAVARYQLGKH
ncbi:MAG: endolytic transglycosylase MltG [Methylophilaceae bacterium]